MAGGFARNSYVSRVFETSQAADDKGESVLHRRSRLVVLAAVVATSALWLVPGTSASAAAADKCPVSGGSVKVGVAYFGAVAAAYSDIGGDASAAGANPDQTVIDGYKAGIQGLNDSGGIAGCTVEPVVFNFSSTSPDYNQMSQQECAAFSQDNKVIAVYTPAFETKVAVDCLAKAKVPYFGSGTNYQPTCADAKAHKGIVYSPAGVYTCRFSSFVKMWDDAGLFPKDAKVGIMVSDDGSGQGPTLADKVYTPQLKKLGIPVETFKYTGAISSASFGAVNATVAQAVLKFKNDGVNVVLFTPVGGQGVASFMPQAATQGYYPNYGVTSADSLVVAAALGATAIKKGIAVSYTSLDLSLTEQQKLPTNTAVEKCAAWSAPSTIALTGSSPYCDFLNFLQQTYAGAKKLDASTLYTATKALGTKFVSSVAYNGATSFPKGRTDGGTKAMMLEFDPSTKSWNPINGKVLTIP